MAAINCKISLTHNRSDAIDMNSRTKIYFVIVLLATLFVTGCTAQQKTKSQNVLRHSKMKNNNSKTDRPRARDIGLVVGVLPAGKFNAITDVKGVTVGHLTLIEGDRIRTGVTAILPHSGNLFQAKVPAAIYVGNGFGKLIGSTQVEELGNIETPILLTNTLNAPLVADGLIEYMLNLPGNENVRSVNPVVGETNDGRLNDIRARVIRTNHVRQAIENAAEGPVEEGSVGAGTGTVCFGFKGGIGSSSRLLPKSQGSYTVGVLVQTNFGGDLTINGAPVGRELAAKSTTDQQDGSCMIVVATDAPILHRNLKRLAKRALLGLARTGSSMANGSGDYVIAFSTAEKLRLAAHPTENLSAELLSNNMMTPLFKAVAEAAEEAVYNSLFKATTITGINGRRADALPLNKTIEICRKYGVLNWDKSLTPK
jgi:D-aminopeptidase